MLRKIIKIDEEKCTGCGLCIPNCPEGALQVIDGKARLISDLFCDGLGACIGHCPEGAITIEEREAEKYDESRVMENVIKGGKNVIKAHLEHLRDHNEMGYLQEAVNFLKSRNIDIPPIEVEDEKSKAPHRECSGSRMIELEDKKKIENTVQDITLTSELRNWPIELTLLNPEAPYLKDADLLIAADCVAFTYANFHKKFLSRKILTIFCPKLDKNIEEYIDKLSFIFKHQNIKSITLLHMEVPCCFGTERIVKMAMEKADKDIPLEKYVISLKGDIKS
ncbi:MAG TPA: 4Fe-4S binding protein [Candidatus Eremiobacteraeota bacterium]|nr:MAG: Ferredoxin-1 [bacterium ADurb.Bin363]HPZ08944.1 4Fe-4S binding protein [Candidatus Eremiobacteraeota bacterium]